MDELTDVAVAKLIAEEAGLLLMDMRNTFGVPSDAAAVTELRDLGDQRSHEHIVARFSQLRPSDDVLSEEAVDDPKRLDAERVWIVDPLDGTREFGQGREDFAVHIVLWTKDKSAPTGGRLTAGVVELPAQKMTRTSADIAPVFTELPTDRPLRIVASRTRPPAVLHAAVDILSARLAEQGFTAGVEVIDVGSVGAKVNVILSGRAEAYVHDTGFWEWDVAAPLSVAHAYGLAARHIDGEPIAFNKAHPYVTDLVVGHPGIASALQSAMAEAGR